MTEKMPFGWKIKEIGDVATVNPSVSKIIAADETIVSFVPMAAVTELTGKINSSIEKSFGAVKKGFTRFKNGDVLFAKITPSMENGKFAVARNLKNKIGCGTTEFHVIRPSDEIDAEYLRYYFVRLPYRQEARQNMQGAVGQQRVPSSFIKKSKIPIPPSNEQKCIVAKIDDLFNRLDDGENSLNQAQVLLKIYRQSILSSAVTGKLTQDWRKKNNEEVKSAKVLLASILEARRTSWEEFELEKMLGKGIKPKSDQWKGKYREPIPPDIGRLPDLPYGWIWCSMDMLTRDFITGPFGSALHRSEYIKNGIPLINPINIRGGSIKADANTTVSEKTRERLSRYKLKLGDIILARRGEMGRCAAVTSKEENWMCGTGSAILRCTSAVLPEFIALTLSSAHSRKFLEDNCAGTTMHNLNQDAMARTPIPIASIAEQRAALECMQLKLSMIESLKFDIKNELIRSNALRQTVLRSAFCGQLLSQNLKNNFHLHT